MEQHAVSRRDRHAVAVLADDLIWASRLRAAIVNAGVEPAVVRRAADIGDAFAVIDLSGRGYDGIAAVQTAASAGATVLAVAQHDDVEMRKAALAAGARRVLSYNKLFSDGPGRDRAAVDGHAVSRTVDPRGSLRARIAAAQAAAARRGRRGAARSASVRISSG